MLTHYTVSRVLRVSSLHAEISRQIRKTLSNPCNGFTSLCFACIILCCQAFFSAVLSKPVNLLKQFIFSIVKQIIYATNRKKNYPRLSGGSLVLVSEVNLNLHVFRQHCTTIYTEQDIKKHLSCNQFSPSMHMFSSFSLSHDFIALIQKMTTQNTHLPITFFF